MSFYFRVEWMASWRSVGGQGEYLKRPYDAPVPYSSRWNSEPHRLPTKSRCVFHFPVACRLWCFAYLTLLFGLNNVLQPYEAFQARARRDHTSFSWFFDDFNLTGAATAAIQQDVAMVFLQSDSGEDVVSVDGNAGDR